MGEGSRELADTLPASSPPEHATDEETPPQGERYRLGAELGRGGMGRVVEAFDTHLGRTVALKEVLPSGGPTIVRRFQREVQITARLEHASIVPLYDSGTSVDGRPYYVMRRVTGRPLDQLIERTRSLADRLALLPNMLSAIDAIAHAHKRGVIHRDVKPQNILVGELGETVVIDWGLAKVVGEPDEEAVEMATPADSLKTQIGSVFGTPGFMAPEQARGEELDQRGDVFALGATLYHVVVGKPPVTGKSATEMIASTLQHKIIPVARAAPGVPNDLIAIVDKALAADPQHRYSHAGELAEDLRRFLTGQLVAAHRYTSWQRFTRFAKRHRAVLGVATAASVVLAVLAWVSVHRVLTERDAARAARADAEAQRFKADTRATELKAQTDRLTLGHARSLLDTSPTEVVALLKDVDPSPEARAIVRAAVTRGVAWAMPSLKGQTTGFEMAPDGKHVFQLTFEGELQIIDLDLRRPIVTKSLGTGASARWVGTKLFITRTGAPPDIFDPTTGVSESLSMPPVLDLSITESGDRVAYVDSKFNVGMIDVATRAVTPVWTSGKATRDIQIARDGSFIAFGEAKPERLVVVDRTGKQLVERPGRAVAFAASASGKLAVSFYEEIVEITPATGKVAKVPLEGNDAKFVHFMVYRGDVLAMMAMRNVLMWGGYMVTRSEPFGDTVYYGVEAGGNTLVVGASDNAVHLLRDGVHLAVPLTSRPKGIVRMAAQRGSTRIAAVAGDAVLLWDIADLLPHLVQTMGGTFVDRRTVLMMGGSTADWTLVNVDTGASRSIDMRPWGMAMGLDVDDDGRFAGVIEHGGADGKPAITTTIVSADRKTLTRFDGGTGTVKLVPGEGVIAAATGGKVIGKLGAAEPRELVTLDGEVVSLCATGPRAYAALSSAGELVKGTLDGKVTARVRIDMKRNSFIVCFAGDVVIAAGNQLLRWHGDTQEVARFVDEPAGTIRTMWTVDAGLVMTLANGETYFVAGQGDQTPQRVPLTGGIAVSVHGNVIASLAVAGQVELVEVPSLARWSLPRVLSGATSVSISSDGQRIAATYGGDLAVASLPPVGRDYGLWLDELTNATLVNGQLQWPWQPKSP